MRNLKRALSLTLASVMLLGMMIVGTSAAPYTDEDQISNKTAAAVLKELKVMVGDGTTFGPNTTVTRGQMAIMICKIMYGNRLNVDTLAKEQKFDDVPANSYFAGYVNFAAEQGIISGYGNGNFGPGDPVSTAQASLMLCRALGYFQGGELTGQGWAANALTAMTMATKLNLFGDLRLNTNDELSRDNVAAMVFNTMTKAVPVMYSDTWKVYYTDSRNVLGGTTFNYLNSWAYQNYDLVYKTITNDLGQIQTRWGIGTASATDVKGDLISSSVTIAGKDKIIDVAAEVVVRYDSKMTDKASTVRSDITGYTLDGARVWLNGEVQKVTRTETKEDGSTVQVTEDQLINSAAQIAALATGNGIVVEVYAVDGVITDVVKIVEEMTQVSAINASKKTITLSRDGSTVTLDENDDVYADLAGNVEIGDYVLAVIDANKSTLRVAIPKTVSGVVSRYNQDGHLTMDSAVYKPSTVNVEVAKANNLTAAGSYTDTKSECVIYLDSCGYALAVDNKLANAEHVCYVADVEKPSTYANSYTAYVFLEDGTSGTYTVSSVDSRSTITDISTWATGTPKGLYVYRLSDNNISLMTTANAALSGTFGMAGDGTQALKTTISHSNAKYMTQKTSGGVAADDKEVYFNGETVFFSHDTNKDVAHDGSDVVKDGYITVSTGLKTIDEVALNKVSVLYETVNGRNIARAVYTSNTGSVAGFSANLIYLSNQDWQSSDSIDYDVDVVFTGDTEKSTITMKGTKPVGLYTYSQNSDKTYNLSDAVANGKAAYAGEINMVGKDTMELYNGTTTVQINKVNAALVFDNTTSTITQTNQAFLGFTDKLTYYGYVAVDNTNDRNALAIYIVARAENILGGTYHGGTGVKSDPILIDGSLSLPAGYTVRKNNTSADCTLASLSNGDLFQMKKDGATTLWYKIQGTPTVAPAEVTAGAGAAASVNEKMNDDNVEEVVIKGTGAIADEITVKPGKKLTVEEGSTLNNVKLGAGAEMDVQDADATVTIKGGIPADADVKVTKGATVTIEGEQRAPVVVTDIPANTDLSTAKSDFAAMLPNGGQIELGSNIQNSNVYNPTWGMIELVIPAGKQSNLVIEIYKGSDMIARTGDKSANTAAGVARVIGLTTNPLDAGCFEYVDGSKGATNGTTGSYSLKPGTYKYVVKEGYVSGTFNSTNAGTPTGALTEILSGYFTVE